ncbi:MAG: competence/damage-inducible protein A, partial [Thermomicrobiales bacterium]
MRAHVLSIGSELILGHLTDTNATFLAQELSALGIELLHVTQVGDDRARLAATIRLALIDADVVICTGGVGPTDDDLTREAITDVVGETPQVDPDLVMVVESFFRSRGIDMPERNRKQAWLIPSAEPLPNPVGTAPGWAVRSGDRTIIAMPGVPREMFRMWKEQAVPRITRLAPGRVVRSVTLRTLGIGESAAEQTIDDLVKTPNPVVATYAKDDGVHIRVTAIAATESDAIAQRDATATVVSDRLGRYVYASDDLPLPAVLARLLANRALTIAVSDSGGCGRFASLLASHPNAATILCDAGLTSQTSRTAGELAV